MKNNVEIKFRCLEDDDCEVVYKWNNDQSLKIMYSGHPFPVSKKSTREWINKVSNPDSKLCLFGIESQDELIGLCGLKNINHVNNNAELFILLDPDQSGKGYATKAVSKLVKFGFDSLNLNRIYLKVQDNNLKAIKLYERCHFTKEGVLRKAVFKVGQYLNIIVMTCLKEDSIVKL